MSLYLREWRKSLGFTLTGLGEAADVGFVTISRAERGEQSLRVDTLEKIAEALGIRPGKLFEPPPQQEPKRKTRRKDYGK